MDKTNTKTSNLVKQGAILASAGILARFIGFLYRLPLTEMLDDAGNGIYAAGYNIYALFLIISSAGLPTAISKMVSERIAHEKYREAHSIFRLSMIFAGISGFLTMIILFLGAKFFENFTGVVGSRYAIMTLAPTVFLVSIMSVYRGYFQGMKNTLPTASSQVVEQIFNAIFSIIMCYILLNAAFSTNLVGGNIAAAAAGGTSGTGIGAIFGLLILTTTYKKQKKGIQYNARKDKSSVKDPILLLKELMLTALPIIIGVAIFTITNIIDSKMIMSRLQLNNAFSYDESVAFLGQYTGKYLVLISLPLSISTSLATASIPDIAQEIASKNIKSANEKINFTIKLAMIITIPSAIGISVLADPILWCITPGSRNGAFLLTIGGVSVIFLGLTQILAGMLQGMSKLYIPIFASIIGSIVKIFINYKLIAIPKINVIGAVIGTIICYLIASLINYYYVQKITRTKINVLDVFIKPFISALIMGFFVFFVYKFLFYILSFISKGYFTNLICILISVAIGVAIYFICLYKIKGIKKEEIEKMPMGTKINNFLFR